MKTVFKRESEWYNPFFVNGKEIYKFYIFTSAGIENKKIIGSFRWLSSGCYGSNNSLNSFTINAELKNKRVFDRKEKLFMIKEMHHAEKVNVVYIDSSLVTLNKVEGKGLDLKTYTQKRFNFFFKNLEYTARNEEQVKKLGIGFTNDGERTQTDKQKATEKIENLFRDKFGNKVSSYYMSDLAKFFKQHSRLASKAELK